MKPKNSATIAVLGAGGWGTALAATWCAAGHAVALWSPFAAEINAIRRDRENRRVLPGVKVPPDLRLTSRIEEALEDAGIAVLATPSRHVPETARLITSHSADAIVVSAAKGLIAAEPERVSSASRRDRPSPRSEPRPLRLSEAIRAALPNGRVAVLSGPSHAEEVGRGLPTTVVVAGDGAEILRDQLATARLRIYTSTDIIGVELGGTLKNPIAIAAGISEGLGAGDNAMGALVTRGMAEVARLGVAAGADARTFAGLSGIGDLVTTCISRHSRNRRVGVELAAGRPLAEILETLGMVAEGVETARIAARWAEAIGVETPIIAAVARVLFENAEPRGELERLMTRSLKDEF